MNELPTTPIRFAGYRLIKRLGGSGGRIVHLVEREGSRPVTCVLKKLEAPRVGELPVPQLDGFCRQVDLMRRLDHPSIVRTLAPAAGPGRVHRARDGPRPVPRAHPA
jgi:hypothetical protein